jgi:hypothetical protein
MRRQRDVDHVHSPEHWVKSGVESGFMRLKAVEPYENLWSLLE